MFDCRPGVQEAAVLDVPDAALRAADDLVAVAVGREAIVAVGRDLGHGQRLWPLFFERRNLCRQSLLPAEIFR